MNIYLNKTTWTNHSIWPIKSNYHLVHFLLWGQHLVHIYYAKAILLPQTRINFIQNIFVQGASVNALTCLPSCVMYLLDLWLGFSYLKLFQLSCLWEGCSLGLINLVWMHITLINFDHDWVPSWSHLTSIIMPQQDGFTRAWIGIGI